MKLIKKYKFGNQVDKSYEYKLEYNDVQVPYNEEYSNYLEYLQQNGNPNFNIPSNGLNYVKKPKNTNDKLYNSVLLRYKGYYDALRNLGSSVLDSLRLARFLTIRDSLESGYTEGNDFNNLGGVLTSDRKLKPFNSLQDYFNYLILNNDSKWGVNNANGNWRDSLTLEDFNSRLNYPEILSKEQLAEFRKLHPNTYIYAPSWDNDNYSGKLNNTANRVDYYINLLPYTEFKKKGGRLQWKIGGNF